MEATVHLAKIYKRLGSPEKTLELFDSILADYETTYAEDFRGKVASLQKLLAAEKERSESAALRTKAEHYERELSNSTLQLVAQTELLAELRDDLLKFIRKFPMPDGAAKELRDRLKTLPCKSVDWERFDTQFKAAHPEFTKTLLEKCPDLTSTEVRICSLLRMNLRSAEIGRLLCLSERSVEGHRTHVRKKMKLPRGEDLMLHLARM